MSAPILARYAREIAAAIARGHVLTAGRIEAERAEYLGALTADCDQCGCPVPRATLAILTRDATGEPDLYCCRACRGADGGAS